MTLSSEEEVEERDLKEEDFDIMGRNEEREWEIEIVEREMEQVMEQKKQEKQRKLEERQKELEAEGHSTEQACRREKRVWE